MDSFYLKRNQNERLQFEQSNSFIMESAVYQGHHHDSVDDNN